MYFTFEAMLAKVRREAAQLAMLASKVEDMMNTVVRQIAFYSFERKVHTERRNGEFTADDCACGSGWHCRRKTSAPRSS